MSNPLEAALSDQAAEDTAQTPPEAAEPASPPEGPPRGPAGKFVSQPASPPPPAAPPPAAPPPEAQPGGGARVPLQALREEREQRQAAQKALKELQDRLAADQADKPRPAPPAPEQQLAADHYAMNLRVSRKFAAKEYGADYVQTVHDWALARCETDPFFNEQMRASDDPYEDAVQAYKREEILAQVSATDLEAFNAWKAANATTCSHQPPGAGHGEAGLHLDPNAKCYVGTSLAANGVIQLVATWQHWGAVVRIVGHAAGVSGDTTMVSAELMVLLTVIVTAIVCAVGGSSIGWRARRQKPVEVRTASTRTQWIPP